jgi:hypothetical protein
MRKRHFNREALHRKAMDGLELLGFKGATPLAAGLLRSGRTLLNGKTLDLQIFFGPFFFKTQFSQWKSNLNPLIRKPIAKYKLTIVLRPKIRSLGPLKGQPPSFVANFSNPQRQAKANYIKYVNIGIVLFCSSLFFFLFFDRYFLT